MQIEVAPREELGRHYWAVFMAPSLVHSDAHWTASFMNLKWEKEDAEQFAALLRDIDFTPLEESDK